MIILYAYVEQYEVKGNFEWISKGNINRQCDIIGLTVEKTKTMESFNRFMFSRSLK